jgi:hypothetical protein
MGVKLDAISNQFPAVTWVDADKQGEAVNLIFGTRVEVKGLLCELDLRPPSGKISNSSSMVRSQREAKPGPGRFPDLNLQSGVAVCAKRHTTHMRAALPSPGARSYHHPSHCSRWICAWIWRARVHFPSAPPGRTVSAPRYWIGVDRLKPRLWGGDFPAVSAGNESTLPGVLSATVLSC